MNLKYVSIWIVSIILISNSTLFAQEKGIHEIEAGYGTTTSNYLANSTAGIFASLFSFGFLEIENIKTSGLFYFKYKYAIANKWMIGAIVSYEQLKEDASFIFNSQTEPIKYRYITTGLEAGYHYISKPLIQIYSGFGIAYSFETNSSNLNSFLWHLNALGIRVGKSLAFFGELGFGYNGILSIGGSYQF